MHGFLLDLANYYTPKLSVNVSGFLSQGGFFGLHPI